MRPQLAEPDGQADAKVDELTDALTTDEVNLATVEHVQGWVRRNCPNAWQW